MYENTWNFIYKIWETEELDKNSRRHYERNLKINSKKPKFAKKNEITINSTYSMVLNWNKN